MKFNDLGIIISIRKYGENSAILKIISKENGVCSGFIKYANSKKSKAIYQVGNLISFEFRSRVDNNLGSFFAIDLVKSYLAEILFNKLKLDCVRSVLFLIDAVFLEGESQENLFSKFESFLIELSSDKIDDKFILVKYIKMELEILKILGYEVDLRFCVVTNSQLNLAFVSPKSARAVSYEAGLPYANKLLILPSFLIDGKNEPQKKDLIDGLKLTGYFLEKYVFEQDDRFNKIRSTLSNSLSRLKD